MKTTKELKKHRIIFPPLHISDVINPWTVVNTRKDMPHKSQEIIILTDMGWPFTARWDAHDRKLYKFVEHNHRVDGVHIPIAGNCIAWCEMPKPNDDWE